MDKFLNVTNVHNIADKIHNSLNFPYVHVQISTLGGLERPSILITISKSPKELWVNGILENSKYAKIHIETYGEVEHFSGSKLKMRKFTSRDVNQIINKINNIKEK